MRELELAGLVERLAANLIDSFLLILPMIIVAIILASGGHALPHQLLQFVFLAIPVAYHWYFWTRRDGQTPGKFALGIRVIRTDGDAISDVDALIRAIGYNVSSMLFGLGFIWALFSAKKSNLARYHGAHLCPCAAANNARQSKSCNDGIWNWGSIIALIVDMTNFAQRLGGARVAADQHYASALRAFEGRRLA